MIDYSINPSQILSQIISILQSSSVVVLFDKMRYSMLCSWAHLDMSPCTHQILGASSSDFPFNSPFLATREYNALEMHFIKWSISSMCTFLPWCPGTRSDFLLMKLFGHLVSPSTMIKSHKIASSSAQKSPVSRSTRKNLDVLSQAHTSADAGLCLLVA